MRVSDRLASFIRSCPPNIQYTGHTSTDKYAIIATLDGEDMNLTLKPVQVRNTPDSGEYGAANLLATDRPIPVKMTVAPGVVPDKPNDQFIIGFFFRKRPADTPGSVIHMILDAHQTGSTFLGNIKRVPLPREVDAMPAHLQDVYALTAAYDLLERITAMEEDIWDGGV